MICEPEEQRHVLVRIYGEILDNRAKFYEGVIFTLLAERGFGPHLYGVFSSGRIEQYIPVIFMLTSLSVFSVFLVDFYLHCRP